MKGARGVGVEGKPLWDYSKIFHSAFQSFWSTNPIIDFLLNSINVEVLGFNYSFFFPLYLARIFHFSLAKPR